MKAALTIAGFDPTGGAGVQADLKVFRHFGVYGLSAVSALTAQNTVRVTATGEVSRRLLEAQLNTLVSDIRPDAVKTGMLLTRDAVIAVASLIRAYSLCNVVIDPVVRSSSGARLIEEDALEVMKTDLFPLATVITPNIAEAAVLSGMAVSNTSDMEKAARALQRLGPEYVVVTGGHLDNETHEVIFDGESIHHIKGKKVPGEYHGTGCVFSAAIAALLAKGTPAPDAARAATELIRNAIHHAHTLGRGMKILNI